MKQGDKYRSKHTGKIYMVASTENPGKPNEVVYFRDEQGSYGSEQFIRRSIFEQDCERLEATPCQS